MCNFVVLVILMRIENKKSATAFYFPETDISGKDKLFNGGELSYFRNDLTAHKILVYLLRINEANKTTGITKNILVTAFNFFSASFILETET